MYIRTNTHTHTRMYLRTYVRTYIHTYIIRKYVHTYVHSVYTRWFKYDRDCNRLVYTQIVPVIFEPPCTYIRTYMRTYIYT